MTYFLLATDCVLVHGQHHGVLHDVTRGTVFVLDDDAYRLLRQCEGPTAQALDDMRPADVAFLARLRDRGLGSFDSAPGYVDKLTAHSALTWDPNPKAALTVRQVDWQITANCPRDCDFCPRSADVVVWQGCTTCVRHPGPCDPALFADPPKAVHEIAALGAGLLHIRGGDPLAEWDRLNAIADAAHGRLPIAVTTPALAGEPDAMVDLGQRQSLLFNVVLMGADVTRGETGLVDAMFARQIAAIDRLVASGSRFTLTVLVDPTTAARPEAITAFTARRWQRVARLAGAFRPSDSSATPHFRETTPPVLRTWRSLDEWFVRTHRNACLNDRVEIGPDGAVHPCAGFDACGQTTVQSHIGAAVSASEIRTWWFTSPSRMAPCQACALRQVCTPCAAAVRNRATTDTAPGCPHDPRDPRPIDLAAWGAADGVGHLRLGGDHAS